MWGAGVPHRRDSPRGHQHPGLRREKVWDAWVQRWGMGISRGSWRAEDMPAEPGCPPCQPGARTQTPGGVQTPEEELSGRHRWSPCGHCFGGVEESGGGHPPRGALAQGWRGSLPAWVRGSGGCFSVCFLSCADADCSSAGAGSVPEELEFHSFKIFINVKM